MGGLIREYVYLHGAPLAQVDSGEALTYLHTDHLGTPRYATNTSGVQVWNWSSDAFGVGTPTGSATVNLRFAGQYWDSESSLHYNWNRYYDPTTGRYIISDPIGLAGGFNTYGYVSANPVMFIDPEGLFLVPILRGILWIAPRVIGPACRYGFCTIGRQKGGQVIPHFPVGPLPPVQRVFPDLIIPGDYCPPSDPDGDEQCDELRREVIKQKQVTDSLGKCKLGMTRDEIKERMTAFEKLFYDRVRRDDTCFGGGDAGHRQAQTNASGAVRRCAGML